MKRVVLLMGLAVLLVGCASIKQAASDYQTGKNTPLANSEIAPAQQAAPIAATVASLPVPFAAAAAPIVLFLATGFFTWQRGVQIRKNNGQVQIAPAINVNMFTAIIQDVANIAAGAFSTPQNGSTASSVLQRVWKVALATIASAGTLAAASPAFMTFLTGHPVLDSVFVAVTSGIAGLEKGLSNVPVVASIPAAPSAPVTA